MAKTLNLTRSGYQRLENAGKTISFAQIDAICYSLDLRVILISEAEFEAINALKMDREVFGQKKGNRTLGRSIRKSTKRPK